MGLDGVLKVLTIIAIISYIGVNLIAPLPTFLIGENITYAILYLAGLLYMARDRAGGKLLLGGVASFNAGRLSRSVIQP